MAGERQLLKKERNLLREALLDSYTYFDQVRQMVDEKMDDRLLDIAHPISMMDGVAALIGWALENDRVYELAVQIRVDRPRNPKVIELWETIESAPRLVPDHLKSAAAQLEHTAIRLAEQIQGDDVQWIEIAHRLEPSLPHAPKATRKQVIRSFASLPDRGRAGTLTTALLLRMAELTDQDTKAIAEVLGEYWEAARLRIQNLFGGRAVYVVAVKSQNWPEWVVDHVWSYGGPDNGPPSPLPGIAAEGMALAEVLVLLEEDMNRNRTRDAAVVELAVPLRGLLEAPADGLSVFYCLAFRWRERTEERGQFRLVGRRIEHLTAKIKARCQEGAVGSWLSPTIEPGSLYQRLDTESEGRLDLAFLRHEADQSEETRERTFEKLLSQSAVPFAVICRPSLPVDGIGHEDALSQCAAQNRELGQLPRQIHQRRAGEAALNHCTVFWDDFDYNPFRLKYS